MNARLRCVMSLEQTREREWMQNKLCFLSPGGFSFFVCVRFKTIKSYTGENMAASTVWHPHVGVRPRPALLLGSPARRISNLADLISGWSGSDDFEKARPGL